MAKIVKFANGTFAVRRFSFLSFTYEYLDTNTKNWWPKKYNYYVCANLEIAQNVFNKYYDKGTPV